MTEEQIRSIDMLNHFKSNHKKYKQTNKKIDSLIRCVKNAKKFNIIDIYSFVIETIQYFICIEKNQKVRLELAWLYNGCQYDFYCNF